MAKKNKGEGGRCGSKAWVEKKRAENKKIGMKWKVVMRGYNRWRNEERRAVLSVGVRAGSGSERDDERKGSPLYR